MALILQNLENHSGSGGGLKIFSYNGSHDTPATIKASGYFNDAASLLNVGDRILVHASNADYDCHVTTITNGVVATAAIDVF